MASLPRRGKSALPSDPQSGRSRLACALLPVVTAMSAAAQDTQAVVGGTLIDGTGAPPVADAVVLVRSGRVVCAGTRAACPVPRTARRITAAGKWVMPGLIDAHVHFSQTGWFDGRPDAGDFRDRYPYPKVIAALEADPQRFFDPYLCSGVTSVFDVGGYPWTWDLRRRYADDPRAPRIAVAGPLLSTIDHWLNLPGQQQFDLHGERLDRARDGALPRGVRLGCGQALVRDAAPAARYRAHPGARPCRGRRVAEAGNPAHRARHRTPGSQRRCSRRRARVLDADPTADVRNLQRVRLVMKGGEVWRSGGR